MRIPGRKVTHEDGIDPFEFDVDELDRLVEQVEGAGTLADHEGVDPGGVVVHIDFTEEEYEDSMDGEITGLGVALLEADDGWRVETDVGP